MINSNPSNSKKNQKILKIVIGAGLLVLAVLFVLVTDDKKPETVKVENKIKVKSLVDEGDLIKTKWMGDVSTDLDLANASFAKTKEENKLLKDELGEIKSIIKKMQKGQVETEQTTQESFRLDKDNSKNSILSNGLFNSFPLPVNVQKNSNNTFMQPQKTTVTKVEKMSDTLNLFEIKKKDNYGEGAKEEKKPEHKEYLPTGSITKVILLSGFDAPTMSQAKTSPLPILMKMTDMSILPNLFKYDLRECFAIGEGYGDLSSERVYIRTNTLSCMTKGGKHIDMEFKAMVTGEDGKVGLRGTVITKQGSMIARSLIAGFLEGIGGAFQQSQEYSITGATGATTGVQAMSAETAVQYGAFGGASKAAEKLADFYLKLADQTAPVIEISAQREVELITTGLTVFKVLEDEINEK